MRPFLRLLCAPQFPAPSHACRLSMLSYKDLVYDSVQPSRIGHSCCTSSPFACYSNLRKRKEFNGDGDTPKRWFTSSGFTSVAHSCSEEKKLRSRVEMQAARNAGIWFFLELQLWFKEFSTFLLWLDRRTQRMRGGESASDLSSHDVALHIIIFCQWTPGSKFSKEFGTEMWLEQRCDRRTIVSSRFFREWSSNSAQATDSCNPLPLYLEMECWQRRSMKT